MKHTAIYARVSTDEQSHASQRPDLERCAKQQDGPVEWYTDTASGRTMQRPGWQIRDQVMNLIQQANTHVCKKAQGNE